MNSDSMASINSINAPNFEDFIRRKSPLSNNYAQHSTHQTKKEKNLRKTPSYTNTIHMNRYEHINNHNQGMGHIHSRTSSSASSSRRNSSVEFSTNDLLRKSRLPPQTSSLLASASSALQAKKMLHNLYHQKPPLSPTSIRFTNKKHNHSIDHPNEPSTTTSINNANTGSVTTTNPSSTLNGIPGVLKAKYYYQSPRSSITTSTTKDKEKVKDKEKERVDDISSISSQSNDDDDEVDNVSDVSEEEGERKRSTYNPTLASYHHSLHVTIKDEDYHHDEEVEENGEEKQERKGKGKGESEEEDDDDEDGEEEKEIFNNYSPIHENENENEVEIENEKTPTNFSSKGTKSNSLTINSHIYPHSSSHGHNHGHSHGHGHNHGHGHSPTKNKQNSLPTPTSLSPSILQPFTMETPSTSTSTTKTTSHRSGTRPPSINTTKLGIPSSLLSQNTTSPLGKARTLDYPASAPIHPNHPTTVIGSAYPTTTTSVTPLRLHSTIDPTSAYTNILLSSLSPTSAKERGHSSSPHRNYVLLGNKHILKRKKSNIVRSPASFPSLSRMNN
ncbi:hypothetical protein PIROE2DRAFT_16469 [Piromyces sp. E2]|nr:hypothetical protein PIROE2DRAFT_16469 [Piromyces sp. E2]|eukprot:OUM58300.1 hypothetical protein PIROE2DRAFT_16469 [Piromyces sp. E2]